MNKHKVLVVDDEPAIRETISELLACHDFEVATAVDGKDALNQMKRFRPDLVLCDWMMPVMDGLEVLHETRSCPNMGHVPFIFVSAKMDRENIRMAMGIGADDFVTKPFKASDLLEAISSKLKRFEGFRASLQQARQHLPAHFSKHGFHEFNTPVNGIIGALDFLIEHDTAVSYEERQGLFVQMQQSAAKLKRTHTNLMLYAKMMRGEPLFSSRYVCSVLEASERALKRIGLCYPELNPAVELTDTHLALRVEALELLVFELLDNACKFGHPEKVPVLTGEWIQENQLYRLAVRDFGKGLSANEVEAIGPFVQFNREQHLQQGWGLGLYLVKALCEAHGLHFSINSSTEGTTVAIDFPLT